MSIVHDVVAFPMTELCSFRYDVRPFFDADPVRDTDVLLMFSSVLFPPYAVSATQVLAKIVLTAFHAVDVLVDAFLVEIRFMLFLQSSGDEVWRPAELQKPNDFLLEGRLFDDVVCLASSCFPFERLSLCRVREVLGKLEMLVSSNFSTNRRFVPSEICGNVAVRHSFVLKLINPFAFVLRKLFVKVLVHIL